MPICAENHNKLVVLSLPHVVGNWDSPVTEKSDFGSALERVKCALAVPQPIERIDRTGRELSQLAARITRELEIAIDLAESPAA